jgi:hypothetical protein
VRLPRYGSFRGHAVSYDPIVDSKRNVTLGLPDT